jgi:hypothetical protein
MRCADFSSDEALNRHIVAAQIYKKEPAISKRIIRLLAAPK